MIIYMKLGCMVRDFETIVNNTDICEKLIEIINKGLATDDFFKEELFETLRKMGEDIKIKSCPLKKG